MTYSLDLINAVINYHKKYNSTVRSTSKIFSISKSSVANWIKNIPIKYSCDNYAKTSITTDMLKFIKKSLDHLPFQTQIDMMNKINKNFGVDISVYTIRIILKIIGYSKKKVSRKLFNRDIKEHILKRKNFSKSMKEIIKKNGKDSIISLDESGITRDTYLNYGYTHKSKRLEYYFDISKLPKNRTVIVAINREKVINYKILKNQSANKVIFIEFIRDLVKNCKNKFIVMDNIAFHKSKEVLKLIIDSGNIPKFIPPYSPEFNPIEEVFSLLKNHIRKNINVLTGFSKLDYHIEYFLKYSTRFGTYFDRSFD